MNKFFFNDTENCITEIFETKEELDDYISNYLKDFDLEDTAPDCFQNIFYGPITHRLVFIPRDIKNDPEGGKIYSGEPSFLPNKIAEMQLQYNKEKIGDYCI